MPLAPAAADMLVTFATQAGIALELAAHRRQAERVAVFEDRDRIARDLHDLVIQRLYATGMSLQGTMSLVSSQEAAGRISTAVDALDETIKEIRASIFALQTRQDTKPPGLRTRILQVADEASGILGFPPALQLDGQLDDTVPEYIAEQLLGALREALSNAARHSGATRVDVEVHAGAEVVLLVRDNGSGMPRALSRRSGLANLEERARKLGGTFRIESAEGRGTELDWRVPLTTAP
jgi:signal transduction histidine kinase